MYIYIFPGLSLFPHIPGTQGNMASVTFSPQLAGVLKIHYGKTCKNTRKLLQLICRNIHLAYLEGKTKLARVACPPR